MLPRTIRFPLGLAALLLVLPAFAGKVYQWKDADGVTHYTDTPPPSRAGVQDRELKDAPPPAQAEAKPAEDANCAVYRGNLARLKGSQPVGLDADGDGQPDKEMDAVERAQQVEQTERLIKTYCDRPASP